MINYDRLIFLGFVVGSFLLGIKYESLSIASKTLDEERQEQRISIERNNAADAVASRVLEGLSAWKKNTEVITREMYHEKTNTVFSNTCATDEYVSLFNDKQRLAISALTYKPKRNL